MKISIITPCYNGMPFLPRCIQSVGAELERVGDPAEHVIVDGGSTDGTVDYLASQPQVRWQSEPDDGISDAMNKGMELATGGAFLFLNADDELEPGAVGWALDRFRDRPGTLWLQGSVQYIDPTGTEVGRQTADSRLVAGLRRSTKLNQQAAFMRRELFDEFGVFKTTVRYVMDYDFWLRVFRSAPPVCIDRVVARYRLHEGNASRGNVWHSEYEKHQVRMANREALRGMTWAESAFYVLATYYRSPTVAHYLAMGAARRGETVQALRWCILNLTRKPFQSPEHIIRELLEMRRSHER